MSAGNHTITAQYGGDINNLPSTSPPLIHTVRTASSTGLTSSLNPSTSGQSVTFTATVAGASPTGSVQFMDGGSNLGAATVVGGVASLSASTLTTGGHSITAIYGGDAANGTSSSAVLTQTVNQATTTTGVTSSLNPSTPGQSVTFTATVTGTSPTGTVQFRDGAANLGAAVTLAGGVATLTTAALATGSHSITAVYSGDTNNATSTSAALTQTVNQTTTTTGLTSSLNPSTPGQSVTFTATVTGTSPTGTVQFKDGATNLGAAVTLAGGSASLTTAALTTGSHSITAVYSGDGNNTTSTSAVLTQIVNQTTSTTGVTSSLNPSTPGQSVTFTATVTGTSPTGTVQFKDGATNLGAAVTLAGGVANFTTSSLTTGGHSITAVYSGDGNNATSTSAAFTQTVNQTGTATSLVSSLNPSAPGQSVTFTATVTGTSPTGTVQFRDGAANLGAAVALAGGVANFTTSSLTSGSHSITAVYSGDANNTTSTSAVLTQAVNMVATTTSIVSSLNPSAPGQSVTFTATVTGSSPSGTVQFKDGAANLGAAVALAGGVASFTTSSLTSGGHSISAVYSGDGSNTTSSSTVLTQTVNQAATATSAASSANPSAPGQSVTFSATVTSGGGTPTGVVTFRDGAVAIGSATLAGGVATFTLASLTPGSHSITAVYGGSTLFAASTSAALIQAVSTPADSLKLRAIQALAAPVVGQNSGAAISGAIDAAISEGFSGGGALVTPSGSGVRINFSADPDGDPAAGVAPRSTDPFSTADGSFASTSRGFATRPSPGSAGNSTSRIDDTFGALAYAPTTKAPRPRYVEQRDWLGWAEVRGAVLDHWGSGSGAFGTVPGATMLYGSQINVTAGLTRRLTSDVLVGALGGYETFDYRSDALQGRLKGDGWTVGSYFGWRITESIHFNAAVAYSGIGYNGTAGLASGNFGGERWMVSGGLTGAYQNFGLQIEPSARIYALWEHENAYTDSLGTQQADRNFSTGRASAGVKVAYPIAWSSAVALAPYLGLYGDYYFNSDNATAALAASELLRSVVLDGYSARAIGGVTARFVNGGQVALGAERGGIGGTASVWIYRARASVPF